MKIKNYMRYLIGIYLGFCLYSVYSLSWYNIGLILILIFIIIKDLSNGNKV